MEHLTALSGIPPAGRLDINLTKVMLFTRVYIVAHRLIEPESKIPKEYVVRVQPGLHGKKEKCGDGTTE